MNCMFVAILSLLWSAAAHAETPPHGDFAWRQLYGMYQFESCENSGSPIWEGEHQRQYIVIDHDPFDTREMPADYFSVVLFHTPPSPIVPIWEMSDMGRGPVKTYDEKTGAVRTMHDNFATTNGAYSRMEWNFGEDNGWATFALTKDGDHISYVMDRRDELSGNSRHERCRLVRVKQ